MQHLIDMYSNKLKKLGRKPEKIEEQNSLVWLTGQSAVERHLLWMLEQINLFHDEEKKHRWLGFIQGCLYMLGMYSLEELRDHVRNLKDV